MQIAYNDMIGSIALALQTVYAELVDICGQDAFARDFAAAGTFTAKTVRKRRYWYFQASGEDGARQQRYVGAETPELLERIERHRKARSVRKDRHALVSALVRSARLPRPPAEVGRIVEALAYAGVFRLSGLLVGTVAYQTYAGVLGARLPASAIQTGDVDIAQPGHVAFAVEEPGLEIVEALRAVDPTFRAVPHIGNPVVATSYVASGGIRVEFLTPNEGPDSDAPARLPSLGTEAQQLRFLDFLIRNPEGAALLHGEGIYVLVPAPERYALHKLIVARRRREAAKVDKDLRQAASLLEVLVRKRPHELRAAWDEAYDRGQTWRRLLGEGLGLLPANVRDGTLMTVGRLRSVVPGLHLSFSAPAGRYDFDRDIVGFVGEAGGQPVRCAISREALEDHFGGEGGDGKELTKLFRANRSVIERLARAKYLGCLIEDPDLLLIKTEEVERLQRMGARSA